jgi:hypothetical protein
MNILIKKTLFIFFLFSFSSLAQGQGKVLFSKGKSFFRGRDTNQKLKRLKVGHEFKSGTTFITNKGALVILSLGASKVKLPELSEFTYEGMKKGVMNVSLQKGSSFFSIFERKIISKKKQNYKFVVKSNGVAMGVRGTEFFASLGKKDTEDLWMCVNEGFVDVKDRKGKVTLVKAGEGVRVVDGKKTTAPKFLPWTKKLNWNMNPKKGDLKNKVNIEDAYEDVLDLDYD